MRSAAEKAKAPRRRLSGGGEPGRSARPAGRVTEVPTGKGAGRSAPRPANDTTLQDEDVAIGAVPEEIADVETGVMGLEGPEGPDIVSGSGPESISGFDDAGLGDLDGEVEVTVVTSAGALRADASEDDHTDVDPVRDPEDGERTAEGDGEGQPAQAREAGEDEPQSFLAMYFRDMAELDVLRPEQEFETARHIENMEIDLWATILGHAPAAAWIADVVEKAVGAPVPAFKPYPAAAEKARPRLALKARSRFDKLVKEIAPQLKEMDIDRVFIDAATAEVRRLMQAASGAPHLDPLPPFATAKGFEAFSRTVAQKVSRIKLAKNAFVKANLRLVVSIARRFNHGRLPLPDLIQEGNIGLMKAVERYDYRRGFRFSTYASWWIRHAISRALADKGRAVRLPVHMIDAYHKIAKSERELQSKLERPATTEEIAAATGIETDKLEKMKTFLAETPVSLDKPISDDDGRRLIDVLTDPNEAPEPPEQMAQSETQQEMLKLLANLKPIEADILRKRFGLVSDRERTLKEIGDEYHLSRERVRQLQEQALGKMRRYMGKQE
jgi:RNA polymerase primary sigma factor